MVLRKSENAQNKLLPPFSPFSRSHDHAATAALFLVLAQLVGRRRLPRSLWHSWHAGSGQRADGRRVERRTDDLGHGAVATCSASACVRAIGARGPDPRYRFQWPSVRIVFFLEFRRRRRQRRLRLVGGRLLLLRIGLGGRRTSPTTTGGR